MKTVRTTTIKTHLDDVKFGFWHQTSEEEGEFYPIQSADDYRKAAEHLGCTPELIDTLSMLHDSLLNALIEDLKDIWKRLDFIPKED